MSHTQNIKKDGYVFIGGLLFVSLIGFFFMSFSKVWSTVDIRNKEKELCFSLIQIQRGVDRYEADYGGHPLSIKDLEHKYLRMQFRDPFREKKNSTWYEDWHYVNGVVRSLSKKKSLSGTIYRNWIPVKTNKGYEIVIREQEVNH